MFVKRQQWALLWALAGLVFLLQAGCTGKTQKQSEEKHWGYSGETGPEYWHTLNPAFAAAKEGKAQSPIDIRTASLADGVSAAGVSLQKPAFDYSAGAYEVENNGHTIELVPDAESTNTALIDGEAYTVKQVHFHAPSEHHLDGTSFAMEVHIVHQNAQSGLAVLGFFITEGAENGVLKEVFENLPPANERAELEAPLNLADLFDAGAAVYRYDGSLTTPPCTEGVKWTVSSQVLELSAEQIGRFYAVYSGNNRPVQPLNGRSVYRVE